MTVNVEGATLAAFEIEWLLPGRDRGCSADSMSLTGAIDTGEVARGRSVMTFGATGMITKGGVALSTSEEEELLEVESQLAEPVKGEGETVEGTLSERDWDASGVASGPKV